LGKRNFSEVFEPINSEYWRRYQIEWFSLLRGRTTTEPAVVGVKHGDEYMELMGSKAQFGAVWPPSRRKVKFQLPWTKNESPKKARSATATTSDPSRISQLIDSLS
jgi:hypothetical protein